MVNIHDKAKYWLELAYYDLETAEHMLKAKRYLYVGFLCHLVAEKSIKAYYWHIKKEQPPFSHNLLRLSELSTLDKVINPDFFDLFDILMPLNIQARYPDDKELLLKSLTNKIAENIISETKEFFLCVKKLIK
ncbi:MAG: HEPN domain-containing protein [Candidatus Muiribacteriota bacterium]|jgi:HEPN domain-containing protein